METDKDGLREYMRRYCTDQYKVYVCDHCDKEALGHMVRDGDGCHEAPPEGWVSVRSEIVPRYEGHKRWERRVYFYECAECYDAFP